MANGILLATPITLVALLSTSRSVGSRRRWRRTRAKSTNWAPNCTSGCAP